MGTRYVAARRGTGDSRLEHASRADEPELHDAGGSIVEGFRAVTAAAIPLLLEGKRP